MQESKLELIYNKRGQRIMKVSSQLKGGIYEVSFGYNTKMEGYMNRVRIYEVI